MKLSYHKHACMMRPFKLVPPRCSLASYAMPQQPTELRNGDIGHSPSCPSQASASPHCGPLLPASVGTCCWHQSLCPRGGRRQSVINCVTDRTVLYISPYTITQVQSNKYRNSTTLYTEESWALESYENFTKLIKTNW